jgi:hypothetical protein
MGRLALLTLLATAIGGAALADNAPPAASTPPAAGATVAATTPNRLDPNLVICKWTEEIGSMLGRHKICQTRAAWDQVSRDAQDATNAGIQRASEMRPPGS